MSIPTLKLYQVPAGRRLDFNKPAGCFAYVYRRQGYGAWQCIARNACSPYFDATFLPAGTLVAYVVRYQRAAGTIAAATPVVQVSSVGVPLLASNSTAQPMEPISI